MTYASVTGYPFNDDRAAGYGPEPARGGSDMTPPPGVRNATNAELLDELAYRNIHVVRMRDVDRLLTLLGEYAEAKFGDEWWPSNALEWISEEHASELACLYEGGIAEAGTGATHRPPREETGS